MNVPPARTPMGEKLRLHGSDKAWPHCFDQIYSQLFPDPLAAIDILEVGLAGGQSIRGFRDHFPNANIMGFDIEWCERYSSDRIECHTVEQTDVVGLWTHIGQRRFDWIIEDAAHLWDKQILTLSILWPALKVGGYYCIEDVATYETGGFRFPDCLGHTNGKFYNLNAPEDGYFDGGQLFVVRKER